MLLNDLQVSKENLKLLMRMYTYIKASVCINSQFSEPFMKHEGVKQGYPASPFVFSLYTLDRLGAFLEFNLLAHLNAPEKRAPRVAGILLPSLIVSDDIIFLATQQVIAQRILDILSEFCA